MFVNVPQQKKLKIYHTADVGNPLSGPAHVNPQETVNIIANTELDNTKIAKVTVNSLLSNDNLQEQNAERNNPLTDFKNVMMVHSNVPQVSRKAQCSMDSSMSLSVNYSNNFTPSAGHHNASGFIPSNPTVSFVEHPANQALISYPCFPVGHSQFRGYLTPTSYAQTQATVKPTQSIDFSRPPPCAIAKRSLGYSVKAPVAPIMNQDYQSPISQNQSLDPRILPHSSESPPLLENTSRVSSQNISAGRTLAGNSSVDNISYNHMKIKILRTKKENISYDEKHQIMAQAAGLGDLEMIKVMIHKYGTHPGIKNNIAIIEASKAGHFQIVDYLMNNQKVNPIDQKHYAMKMAVQYGRLDILERLLQCPKADASYDQNYAIRTASIYGFVDIVRRLLLDNRVDPTVKDFYPIRHAAKNGHMEVVELLLSDHRVNKQHLLISASKNKKAFGRLIDRLLSE